MISMVHRDGDTTIQMVEMPGPEYEVSLQVKGQGVIKTWTYQDLRSAIAGYVLVISAELACYVDAYGNDVPWYDAVKQYAVGGVERIPGL